MAAKNYFEILTENQTKLMETLAAKTTALVELMTPAYPEVMDKAAFETYYAAQKEIAEGMLKVKDVKEMLDVLPTNMNKALEANTALYNNVVGYYKGLAEKNTVESGKTLVEKTTELYKDMFNAVYETATANTKAIQELF
jgi:hypothetical protein